MATARQRRRCRSASRRADDIAAGFLLVTFDAAAPKSAAPRAPSATPEGDAYVRRLQQQLDELKWHLRDTVEQYDGHRRS